MSVMGVWAITALRRCSEMQPYSDCSVFDEVWDSSQENVDFDTLN